MKKVNFKKAMMFTGIITHLAIIAQIIRQAKSIRLVIACEGLSLVIGQSVAMDGMCVTVIACDEAGFTCDISPETLNKTICRYYREGSVVNIELAMILSERFNGHIVLGHVDSCVRLVNTTTTEGFVQLQFGGVLQEDLHYLIAKGSVTLNGVSLTINKVLSNGFEVMLIPETLHQTNLKSLLLGDEVNVEYDYLAKVIVRQYQLREGVSHDAS